MSLAAVDTRMCNLVDDNVNWLFIITKQLKPITFADNTKDIQAVEKDVHWQTSETV